MLSFYCISKTDFLFFLQVLLLKLATANTKLIGSYCHENGNYTKNSIYEKNLNNILTDLSVQASTTRFYNSTKGRSPNIVYGQFYCREDASHQPCHKCVQSAAREILNKCKNQKEASIVYEICTLSYTNRSKFFPVEADPNWWHLNANDNVSNPKQLEKVLSTTLGSLIRKAAYNKTYHGYETEKAPFPPFSKIDCHVQCSPRIIGSACELCLQGCHKNLQTCCRGNKWAMVFLPNCQMRYAILNSHTPPAMPPRLSDTQQSRSVKGVQYYVTRAVVPAASFVFLLICAIAFYMYRRKKQQRLRRATGIIRYSLQVISSATENFSTDNKLGQGGFGIVYKGRLPDNQNVAIKRLSKYSREHLEEFKNEVHLVSQLQHGNLVKLLGFCSEAKEKLLVYEFVPNLSLDKVLFGPNNLLDWQTRLKIIIGIAQGLLYLHQGSDIKIIHRDLKPDNILLDREMNPKIADFGVARVLKVGREQAKTTKHRGTLGYMAPEYTQAGILSIKSDVYSFGIMLLEIISGLRNTFVMHVLRMGNLGSHARRLRDAGKLMELVDPSLENNFSKNEVLRCIQVGLLCVQEDPSSRPTMETVLYTVQNISDVQDQLLTDPLPPSSSTST